MAIVIGTKTYNADVPSSKDSQPYLGPNNTITIKDVIELFRSVVKATLTFSGMARTRVKMVRTVTLTGALTPTGDITFDLYMNVPVGASSADVDSAVTDFSTGLSQTWAKDLAKNRDILA